MTQLLSEKQINTAVQIIRNGGLVAFRTETVYGLGADAQNQNAIQKIYTAKKRPDNKPLVMQFASVRNLVSHFPDTDLRICKLLRRFKKGLTVILPNGQGIRIPSDKVARKFLRACKMPLVVTSANTSEHKSPITWQQVGSDLNGKVDAIIMSKPCKLGIESTIIQIKDNEINVMRQGALAPAHIISWWNKY